MPAALASYSPFGTASWSEPSPAQHTILRRGTRVGGAARRAAPPPPARARAARPARAGRRPPARGRTSLPGRAPATAPPGSTSTDTGVAKPATHPRRSAPPCLLNSSPGRTSASWFSERMPRWSQFDLVLAVNGSNSWEPRRPRRSDRCSAGPSRRRDWVSLFTREEARPDVRDGIWFTRLPTSSAASRAGSPWKPPISWAGSPGYPHQAFVTLIAARG